MTNKDVERKLRQAAAKVKKHVDERKADVLARVFERIEKESEKKG